MFRMSIKGYFRALVHKDRDSNSGPKPSFAQKMFVKYLHGQVNHKDLIKIINYLLTYYYLITTDN